MKSLITSIFLATVLVSMSACDSRQEDKQKASLENKADNLENRADAVRDSGEKKADAIEDRDPGMNSDKTQNAAGAVREGTEHTADALENAADKVRDQK